VYQHIRLEHRDALLTHNDENPAQKASENVTAQSNVEKDKPKEVAFKSREMEEPS
jgi:hypothetical protein